MTVRNVGLVSGMDVENIVKSMVQPYQDRYDKEYKNKTTAEWKKDEYKTIYTKEAEFRAKMTEYKLSATVSPVNSNTSNKEVVTAKANSDALNVPHTLKVKQLAKAASVGSSEKMASAGKLRPEIRREHHTGYGEGHPCGSHAAARRSRIPNRDAHT